MKKFNTGYHKAEEIGIELDRAERGIKGDDQSHLSFMQKLGRVCNTMAGILKSKYTHSQSPLCVSREAFNSWTLGDRPEGAVGKGIILVMTLNAL